MTFVAIAFWREMPIAITLLLATACLVTARDIVLDKNFTQLEASLNERLRLTCVVKSNGEKPSILMWYKDGYLLTEGHKSRGQRQWLRINAFKPKDEGLYTCNHNAKEMNIRIRLKRSSPQELEGYQADIPISDRALPETLSQIKSAALVENNTLEENVTDAKRFIKDEDPDEKGEKDEKDHPNYGHVDEKQEYFPPRFKHPTKMYKMDMKPAGNSIRLRCAAEGNPTPNITWYKNRSTPISRVFFQPSYGKWSMALDELTKADNGNYTCVVCNILGCIEHTSVLHIQERYPSKPYIKEGYPGNITVLVNDTVTLSCPPVSDLEPYLYWVRPYNYSVKNAEVGPSDMPIPTGDVIESENPEDKPEQLTIYNITKEDEGWYVCVALNSLGNTTAKGYLTVLESAPPIQEAQDHGKHTLLINILTVVLGAMFFVAAIIVVMICKKLKREKEQKQLAIETARAVIVTHWTKKVTVEKPQMNGSPAATGEGLTV